MTAEERKRTLRGILHDVLYCLPRHLPFKMATERSRTTRSVLHVSFTYKTFLVVNHPEIALGDSRKYPYHTTGGILEFRGRGGVSWTGIPKTWGGNAVWNSKGMGGCFSSEFSEFPEERRRKLRLKSLTC